MNLDNIPVYIGYDSREDIAYKVCSYSILKHNSSATITALRQADLRRQGIYNRAVDSKSSTEFTFTRFLVPYMQNYQGWAVFCDCDFVWDVDIAELMKQADDRYAVMVVKHNHTPENKIKMDGQEQTQYPRKNWSSCILWNCAHPSNQQVTPDLVNSTTGSFLHRFQWLNDNEIGSLDTKWNFLVGWNNEKTSGKPYVYHWTEGGPWFSNYMNCEYADVWFRYLIEYADHVGKRNEVSMNQITWVTSLSKNYWDKTAKYTMPTWDRLPGNLVVVWDDKSPPCDIGQNFHFWKDVSPSNDPWITENMGSAKSDRFWKKSRTQVWAARKFPGLVIWIDADITVNRPLSANVAKKMFDPGQFVWSTIDAGNNRPNDQDYIDTGLVAFNTDSNNFEEFLREYSLMWYNGKIFDLPQPYDHYAVTELAKTWPVHSLCDHWSSWSDDYNGPANHVALKYSKLSKYFTHHLGLKNKERLNKKQGL